MTVATLPEMAYMIGPMKSSSRDLRLNPNTRLVALARDPILDALSGLQLPIYLKLIGAWGEQRTRRVKITNQELYRDNRTAVRVLHQLEDRGLIRLHYADRSGTGRVIEVMVR